MILPIVAYGNSTLRKKCVEIDKDYSDLNNLIENMWQTMYNAEGVGLAAPQIGLSIRLFIIDANPLIDPSETLSRNNINMIADKSYKEKLDKDKNFYNGQQDAITFVLLSNKLLKPDDPDPKLAEAKKLLPQVEELNMSLGIFTEEELQVDQLPVAVLLVTIIDYISANWKNTS